MPTQPYMVGQGDTLRSIAAAHGLNPDDVWNHPDNASLSQQRSDPAILCPGDVVFLPKSERQWLPAALGSSNTYKVKVATETVRLVLGTAEPLANEPYVISGIGEHIQGTTDGSGALSVEVPVSVRSFVLQLPKRNVAHTVLVGHLDPVDTDSGFGQRLSNLGYSSALAQFHEPFGVSLDRGGAHQVRLFQRTSGLEPSGEPDAATVDALTKAHGV